MNMDNINTRVFSAWRPNCHVINFFDNMKHRRVATPATLETPLKITNTGNPTGSRGVTKTPTVKVSYTSVSQRLINTARSQNKESGIQVNPSKRKKTANRTTQTKKANKKKVKAVKKKIAAIEKQIKKAKLK